MPSDASTKRRDGNVGQAELVHAALGREAAVHDRERALRVGAVDRGGQREVRAQAVVACAVVDLVRDAQEPFAGPELERGAHGGSAPSRRCGGVHARTSPTAYAGQS